MPAFWPAAAVVAQFLVPAVLIVFILLRRPARGATDLVWIVLIVLVPLIGVIAYLLLGEARLGRGRMQRHAATLDRVLHTAEVERATARHAPAEVPAEHRSIAALARSVGDNPPRAGNLLRLIGDTDLFIEALTDDIDAAIDHCHLLFYIYLDDPSGRRVAEALMAAAQRGVDCRLLVDAVGSRRFARSALRRRLRSAGVHVVEALPAHLVRALFARLDLRNHRKIAIIDGRIGYVGSHNIADAAFAPKPRFAPWVDTMVRCEGPVAHDLQALFAVDWYLDTGESLETLLADLPPAAPDGVIAQATGTGPNARNEALRQLVVTAIHAAREELILTTPYFVPDDGTMEALRIAGHRGVDTRIILPARNDSPLVAAASRSYYAPLLDAGVSIHEFRAGLLHAKTMTLDRSLAVITTANLDRRSVELNFEASLVVYDGDFASQLRFLQTSYLSDADMVAPERWKRRAWPVRLWQNAAGTLSPIL